MNVAESVLGYPTTASTSHGARFDMSTEQSDGAQRDGEERVYTEATTKRQWHSTVDHESLESVRLSTTLGRLSILIALSLRASLRSPSATDVD